MTKRFFTAIILLYTFNSICMDENSQGLKGIAQLLHTTQISSQERGTAEVNNYLPKIKASLDNNDLKTLANIIYEIYIKLEQYAYKKIDLESTLFTLALIDRFSIGKEDINDESIDPHILKHNKKTVDKYFEASCNLIRTYTDNQETFQNNEIHQDNILQSLSEGIESLSNTIISYSHFGLITIFYQMGFMTEEFISNAIEYLQEQWVDIIINLMHKNNIKKSIIDEVAKAIYRNIFNNEFIDYQLLIQQIDEQQNDLNKNSINSIKDYLKRLEKIAQYCNYTI